MPTVQLLMCLPVAGGVDSEKWMSVECPLQSESAVCLHL